MILYHGSDVPDIAELTPRPSNHEKPYVYLTHSPALATLYAHNALPRPYGWYTYFWQNGQLHYEEYFPGQLELFYRRQTGYIYTCVAELPALSQMPWVYLSERAIRPSDCRAVPDLYQELLRLEAAGEIVLHRHHTLSDTARQSNIAVVQREIQRHDLAHNPQSPYAQFIHTHFPDLL